MLMKIRWAQVCGTSGKVTDLAQLARSPQCSRYAIVFEIGCYIHMFVPLQWFSVYTHWVAQRQLRGDYMQIARPLSPASMRSDR